MNNQHLRKIKPLYVVISVVGCLSVVLHLASCSRGDGHWERYVVSEYEFRDSRVGAEIAQWIDSLVSHDWPTDKTDFDMCYQPYLDTIWDTQQLTVVDSFNLRLHTHSYRNNYLRTGNFGRLIKGACRIKSHVIYLYDESTISKFFQPRGGQLSLRKYIQDEHGFYDWQDELVTVAYSNQRFRKVDTQNTYFYRDEFLFYDSIDFADKFSFMEIVDVDTFVQRSTGPYLLLSDEDERSHVATVENMRKLIVNSLTLEDLSQIDKTTRVQLTCYVDSLGRVSYRNHSSADIYDKVNVVCEQLPNFSPAQVRGKPANSVCCFYFVMFHLKE